MKKILSVMIVVLSASLFGCLSHHEGTVLSYGDRNVTVAGQKEIVSIDNVENVGSYQVALDDIMVKKQNVVISWRTEWDGGSSADRTITSIASTK